MNDENSAEMSAREAAQAAGGATAAPDEIARLSQELAAAKDQSLRAQAEADNVRKRARREIEEERRYANLPLLTDLLPVVDNVARAIEAAEKNADAGGLLEGFRMVAQHLASVLQQHHCQPIEALHQPFDPHNHQAVLQQPSSDFPPGTVLQVVQAGFRLHDRVLRPAQVIVAASTSA